MWVGRQRFSAVTRLGIRRDARSLRELEHLLEDRAPRVRRSAVVWYAAAIHSDNATRWVGPPEMNALAASPPPGLDKLLARMNDENFNVRMIAVQVLGAYVGVDARAAEAMRKALADPKHKVRHAAARILRVQCFGCGRTW